MIWGQESETAYSFGEKKDVSKIGEKILAVFTPIFAQHADDEFLVESYITDEGHGIKYDTNHHITMDHRTGMVVACIRIAFLTNKDKKKEYVLMVPVDTDCEGVLTIFCATLNGTPIFNNRDFQNMNI